MSLKSRILAANERVRKRRRAGWKLACNWLTSSESGEQSQATFSERRSVFASSWESDKKPANERGLKPKTVRLWSFRIVQRHRDRHT
ncbi:F-box/FBD/LRR-repeat protein [Trichinella spiralis]|uniref:F-box/FBD/LRR-repeat protein n=1 Tax=Trichinella spiralis TaxID=6334 RepID=A0ABR3KFU6_TRISP